MSNIHETIQTQWDQMIANGRIPVMEFQLPDNEYLTVNLSVTTRTDEPATKQIRYGVYFEADFEKDVHFSGDVKKKGDAYYLPLDPCFESLDHYLQQISEEVTDGYLLPNDLYVS